MEKLERSSEYRLNNFIFKIFLTLFILIFCFGNAESQNKKKKKSDNSDEPTLSLLDRIQNIIDIRKSFTSENETNKPALFSYKKDNDEKAVYLIDIALSYKGFNYEKSGVTPFVQFDYSSKSKDQSDKLTAGLSSYYRIYDYSGGSGKLEPLISYSKDFFTKEETGKASLFFVPQFPKFFLPVRNVTNIKFKYDGSKEDNRWVIGFNPIFGINFDRVYDGKIISNLYYGSYAGNLTFKRYYLQFDLYGNYFSEFDDYRISRYKYEGTATFYFDQKERSSLNAKYSQEETALTLIKKSQ